MSTRSHPPRQPNRPGAEFMTAIEVAEEWRVSKMTVYRLIHSGELRAVRVRRGFRIHVRDVDAYAREAEGWNDDGGAA